MKNNVLIISGIILFLVVLVWRELNLKGELNEVNSIKPSIYEAKYDLIVTIDSLSRLFITNSSEYIKESEVNYKDELINFSDSLIAIRLEIFKQELFNIENQIVIEKKKLSEIQINKQRALNNLPEVVSLDELYEKYKSNRSETFYTSKGQISFSSYNFSFLNVPSTGDVAYIRIGKDESSENSALIKAFLDESASSKTRQGYSLVSNKEYPADYGSYRIKKYTKGDAYFLTYYQYTRYQGTYNSKYFRYKYYIEIGSTKRKQQFENEQFNSKLGS